ncbi:MAG: hypothetical protein ACOCV2_15520 [Persicimonas sp.]
MADETKKNGVSRLSDEFLTATRELVGQKLDDEDLEEDREAFFEALYMLQSGDLEAAVSGFRRAARKSGAPFDALSTVALAECQRVRGREGAAVREWEKIAADEDAPSAARYISWLSLAAIAEKRDDEKLFERANEALEAFPEH